MVTEREDWALCKQEKGWAIKPFQDSGAETAEILLLQNSQLTSNWKFIVLLMTQLLVYRSQSARWLSDQWLSRPGTFSMAGKSLPYKCEVGAKENILMGWIPCLQQRHNSLTIYLLPPSTLWVEGFGHVFSGYKESLLCFSAWPRHLLCPKTVSSSTTVVMSLTQPHCFYGTLYKQTNKQTKQIL